MKEQTLDRKKQLEIEIRKKRLLQMSKHDLVVALKEKSFSLARVKFNQRLRLLTFLHMTNSYRFIKDIKKKFIQAIDEKN